MYEYRKENIYVCNYMYVCMFKRQEYRERITKTLNFESRIYSDFEKLCNEEHTYPSHKLQEFMIKALQKNQVGQREPKYNPLNLPDYQMNPQVLQSTYHTVNEKPFQADLSQWIPYVQKVDNQSELLLIKGQASVLCTLADKRSLELYKNGIRH